MRSAAARAELPAWCSIHNVEFDRFENAQGDHSTGCPVCVAKIREQVKAMRAAFKKRIRGKAFRCVAEDTGKRKPG